MLKPALLRKFITDNVKWAKENPERLVIFVQKGTTVVRTIPQAGSASFEYRYTIVVGVTDWPHSADLIQVAINAWAEKWQPDLLLNPDRRISFDVDVLDNNTVDLMFMFQADEAVIVKQEDGKTVISHRADPLKRDEGIWELALRDMVDGTEWQL